MIQCDGCWTSIALHATYRWLRHPSYSGALLTFLGFALALGNWLSILLILVFVSVGYVYRITVEERALQGALRDVLTGTT